MAGGIPLAVLPRSGKKSASNFCPNPALGVQGEAEMAHNAGQTMTLGLSRRQETPHEHAHKHNDRYLCARLGFAWGGKRCSPRGPNTVETDEQLLPTMLSTADQRVATWIWLPAGCGSAGAVKGSCQAAAINPAEPKAALGRDIMPA